MLLNYKKIKTLGVAITVDQNYFFISNLIKLELKKYILIKSIRT